MEKKEILDLIIIVIVFFLVNKFIFGVATVNGNSMNPTLEGRDVLIVKKYGAILQTGDYNYGDIVVFKSLEENDNRLFIKRVIGISGDKIEIKNGELYINNNYIKETYIDADSYTEPLEYGEKYQVPKNEIFVMGDNRFPGGSNDSREFASVPLDKLKGKILVRILPLNKVSKF